MPKYSVSQHFEIEADNHEAAAVAAFHQQRAPASSATLYHVAECSEDELVEDPRVVDLSQTGVIAEPPALDQDTADRIRVAIASGELEKAEGLFSRAKDAANGILTQLNFEVDRLPWWWRVYGEVVKLHPELKRLIKEKESSTSSAHTHTAFR